MAENRTVLEVDHLSISFSNQGHWYKAVEEIQFDVKTKETLSIVGESGCGKSVTALSLMKLLPKSNTRIDSGRILAGSIDVVHASKTELRNIRGAYMGMIFQEPGTSLNPVLTVGFQLSEAIKIHRYLPSSEAKTQAINMMKRVGISSPETRFDQYPHELSGGTKQRVMIAMALLLNPKLLIADEPTTALDVTIQAQILDLIRMLQSELGMSMILISHDLGIVAEMANEVIVMYGGLIMEKGSVDLIMNKPLHPYTQALRDALPKPQVNKSAQRLTTIPGRVPALHEFQSYCRFYERCSKATLECKQEQPKLREHSTGHWVRCLYA